MVTKRDPCQFARLGGKGCQKRRIKALRSNSANARQKLIETWSAIAQLLSASPNSGRGVVPARPAAFRSGRSVRFTLFHCFTDFDRSRCFTLPAASRLKTQTARWVGMTGRAQICRREQSTETGTAEPPFCGSSQHVEDVEQDDHRDRDTQQPEKHWAHRSPLNRPVG
jgi:hypothetical protein